ncbi:hypothetical protein CP533_4838 [Ophiocordyceps camponoti-saundersi (nom. inval.)]|nr:hypothetical protein CP533_4838 [Ophiocordyceps camponoti-saundersi (nom. inval.)]
MTLLVETQQQQQQQQRDLVPFLIDDDEASVDADDDYRYHAHAAELWDSFWQRTEEASITMQLLHQQRPTTTTTSASTRHPVPLTPLPPLPPPRKKYPALISSPRRSAAAHQPYSTTTTTTTSSWPLADSRSRKPAASYLQSASPPSPVYSIFPRSPPQPGFSPVSAPVKVCPPRKPWEEVVTPCIRVVTPSSSTFSPAQVYKPPPTPTTNWHPFPPRSSSSIDANNRPRTSHGTPSSPNPHQQARHREPRHHKSVANFPPPPRPAPPPPPPRLEPEPQSVFESDSDDDSESEHGRSFFRFHRRNDSDARRSAKPPPVPTSPAKSSRPMTAPSLADITNSNNSSRLAKQQRKRQGHDVFGRMLGRRSR